MHHVTRRFGRRPPEDSSVGGSGSAGGSSASSGADVVVVGGGIIGLSIAWRAAGAGMKVVVCDPSPGRGATWAAAGMLAPVTEAQIGEEEIISMNLAAAARWPSFARELEDVAGTRVGYEASGTLVVAVDASDMAVVERIVAFHATRGLRSTRLSASECRSVVGELAPGIRGGARSPDDHQVDNRLVAGALEMAVKAVGAEVVASSVSEVTITRAGQAAGSGMATGVSLDDGREIRAGAVVVASGCWTPRLRGIPDGVLPPVRPVKGHILRLRGNETRRMFGVNVRGMVHGNYVYIVPRADGTLVVGATVEEMGYDTRVQAGAVYNLLRDAKDVVPGIAELELYECWAGLRPGSPDNGPFVGWTRIEGLAVATGHYRNGILLAPITADAVCDVLSGKPVPEHFAPFGAERMSGT